MCRFHQNSLEIHVLIKKSKREHDGAVIDGAVIDAETASVEAYAKSDA
jgi:hypothetical protein